MNYFTIQVEKTSMSMIEFDEYKQKLLAQKPTLEELKNALNIDGARQEYARLQDGAFAEGGPANQALGEQNPRP